MEVICEMMKLKPERVKDYIDLHNKTWPDLVVATREAGIVEEYIYILDNLVMVIMKCENFNLTNSILEGVKVFKDWDVKVRDMLMEDVSFFHTKEVLLDLEPVWRLDNFNDKGVLKY
jgi:L-rhamnose mutarotase